MITQFPPDLSGQLGERFIGRIAKEFKAHQLPGVEQEMPNETEIVFAIGQFYQHGVMKFISITVEGKPIGVTFSQLVQERIHRKTVPYLVLRHRGEGNVFFQQRPHSRPFRIAMAQDKLIVCYFIEEFFQGRGVHGSELSELINRIRIVRIIATLVGCGVPKFLFRQRVP